jgi:hypothetical protein
MGGDSMARPSGDTLSAAEAAATGARHVAELTGKEVTGVTSVRPADDGWVVGVEVVEDHRIPSSTDLLALYEAEVAADGTLMAYQRRRRYSRGQGDGGEGH